MEYDGATVVRKVWGGAANLVELDVQGPAGRIEGLELLPREFKLLEHLMRHKDRVVTRTMMLEQLWDYRFDPHTSLIDTHISRLRKKIDDGFDTPLLHTVRGSGYRLSAHP